MIEGVATFLSGKGKPLGLFKDAHWEVQECLLPPASALVVVSDGLLEQLPRSIEEPNREQVLLHALTGVAPDHEAICAALGLAGIRDAPTTHRC